MTKDDGGSAFPRARQVDDCVYVDVKGMSLRDYFAAHAPEWYLAGITERLQDEHTPVASIMAVASYAYADAMLAARKA